MRIKLDEKHLNPIKQKLINKLGLTQEYINRMNLGCEALYVENLKETRNALMISRKNEIAIDQELVLFDNLGTIVGLKKEYMKLIESQLGHEIIHAISRSDGYVGINKNSNDSNRGLNEGLTQMFTEDAFGYVVSRFTDAYGDYKKIAKIMRLCVGNEPVRSAFFDHTDKLKDSCNNLSNDINFYDDINRALRDLYYLRHTSKGKESSQLKIIKNIYYQRIKLCYENIILNLVIPKINKFKTEKEIKEFLKKLLETIKDDRETTIMVIDILKEKLKLNEKQLIEEKNKVQLFSKNAINKHYIFNLIITNNVSKSSFMVDNKGNITYKDKNEQFIQLEEDEELYSYIYNYLAPTYFDSSYDTRINKIIDRLSKDNELEDLPSKWNSKIRRIFLSRLKYIARERGIIILNSYSELDNATSIKFNFINKDIQFEDLKKFVERYEVTHKNADNFTGEYIVIDKLTNKEIKDEGISTNVKFAYLWLGTSKHRYINEPIPGIIDAFSEDNKKLYEELLNIMKENVNKNGNIDLNSLYRYAEKHSHSRMERIVETLLKNPLSYEWTYSFIKARIGKSTLQTEKEKSYVELSNIKYQSSMLDLAVDEIIQSKNR